MDPVKLKKVFNLMKEFGVEYFKNADVEIKMQGSELTPQATSKQKPGPKRKLPPSQAIPPVDMPIPHHTNEVAKLLKLNDNELVDALFPDHSQSEGA